MSTTESNGKSMRSEKQAKKPKLMKYSSKLWSDIVDEYEANMKMNKEPDTIKEKPIKEDQTSTVDIVTKIEPTAKEVKKCSSKDKILSDNSPIQESKDQSKKAKTSNTKISQSKKEDGVKVESIVTSSTSSNNLKEVMYKKKNNEQPLVNLTAPINNLEKDLKTLLEKTLANCDTKDKQSEKPLPKTKKLMKYSSRPWSDIVEEYEAMMMNSKFLM
ncbi:uncharacterized protein LOC112688892 isoform X3 [Sipha flava]|uniref:Uncharacterized protein LOC112688892 isoform X3 n=1 Tax=Sipha flava TaxID=143950 RepID=A0A8B8G588_9HEMI|nr:uncharacterized protein LOC112688892 isoform X3 [Sipha flava]